jgi:cytochrome c biogenesis factor
VPLLGQLALWLALLLGLWGAVIGFAGYRQDRPDLQESARRAVLMLAATLLVAVLSLFVAALRRDFQLAYIAAHADLTLARRDAIAVLLDGVAGRRLRGAFVRAVLLIGARR